MDWRSIVKTRDVLREGLCYRVGSGRDIFIWRDPWVPNLPGFIPTVREGAVIPTELVTVRDLLFGGGSWLERGSNSSVIFSRLRRGHFEGTNFRDWDH